MKRFLNLEVNEVPPVVLREFMSQVKGSYLNKLKEQGRLHIFTTVADDIPEEDLYPSQTWASMNTGISYEQHKCYWYSDPIPMQALIWNELAAKGADVGVIGSLHSSKLPNDLKSNNKYKFYIPDCFSREIETKPKRYSSFHALNVSLVAQSARVTKGKELIIALCSQIAALMRSPRSYGMSGYSLRAALQILAKYVGTGNAEVLRMLQFPLWDLYF